VDAFDPVRQAIQVVWLSDSVGKVRLLNVVNSLDTPVCQVQTRRWEQLRAQLPSDVQAHTVSMDLPFALARWQTAEGVRHELLSSHRSEQFGRDYGVLIKEWRLLQRAVFIVGSDGRLIYAEYVADQMREPDYMAAKEAVVRATSP
jgi:thioredoxin-dependent peroxiredoxin